MAENHPTTSTPEQPEHRRRGPNPLVGGFLNGNWKGGRHIASNGYVKVSLGEGHPLADSKGYIYEHRLIWLMAGNEPPTGNQVIHHRDRNKQNNSIDNLELITYRQHANVHHAKRLPDSYLRELADRHLSGECLMCDQLPLAGTKDDRG